MSEQDLPIKVATIEAKQHDMAERIQEIKENVKDIDRKLDDRFDKIETTLKAYFENADKRFASKWVEKGILLVASTVITAIVGAVLKLVIYN